MAADDNIKNNTQEVDSNTNSLKNNTSAIDENKRALSDLNNAQKNVGDSAEKNSSLFKKSQEIFDTLNTKYEKGVTLLRGMGDAFSNLSKDIKENQNNTSNLESETDKLTGTIGKLFALTTNFEPFKNFSVNGGAQVRTMQDQFDSITSKTGSLKNALDKLGKINVLPKELINSSNEVIQSFLMHADSAQRAQRGVLNLAAASGNLNKFFDDQNKLTSTLNNSTAQFTNKMLETAKATNTSFGEVQNLAEVLGKIPGGLDGISSNTGADRMTTALQLAAGAGKDVSTVLDTMNRAYESLSNSQGRVTDASEKGERLFALMSETSNALNLRFSDTQEYLNTIANGFKNIGDNTEGATKILGRFSNSLQNTGLTAKASLDIITHMTRAVGNLSEGTQALISQRSGGPGGLQGAFQVEQLLRQGKVDQVAKMAENALRQQFGGKIYTQAEAASSQQAASQFYRQRALLQSGAFGNLASNKEDATRLLEALASGNGGTAIKTGNEAVAQTAQRGESVTNKTNSILNAIDVGIDQLVANSDAELAIFAENLIGTGEKNSATAKAIQDISSRAIQRNVSNEGKELDVRQSRLNGNRAAFGDFVSAGEGIVSDFPNKLNQVMLEGKEGFSSMTEIFEKRGRESRERQETTSNRQRLNKIPITSRPPTLNQVPKQTAKIASANKTEISQSSNINITMTAKDLPPFEMQTKTDNPNAVVTLNKAVANGGVY